MTDQATVPPQNTEAETAVLGAVLLTEPALDQVLFEGLRPDDFYRPRHGLIFKAMIRLKHKTVPEPIDALTICDDLRRAGELEQAGGEAYIHSLPTVVPAVGNVRHYAAIVIEHARYRRLASAARDLASAAMQTDRDQVIEAESRLAELNRETTRRQTREERQEAVIEVLEGRGRRWTTPFGKLNDCLAGGMQPGQFTLLGGPSGHGKSVLATGLMEHFFKQGARCAVYTNEMATRELDLREIARNTATVSYWRLVQGDIRKDQWNEVWPAVERLGEAFDIVEAAGMSADEIAYDIRRERWDVAVIDLFNAILNSSKTEDIDHNIKMLSGCSRQANCHIIGCQHLSRHRMVGKDYAPIPVESDIRGSGQLYDLSNNVLFIYRRESEQAPGHQSDDALIRVAKARSGFPGDLDVAFQPNRMRFLPTDDEQGAKAA